MTFEAQGNAGPGNLVQTRVFISYSRKDGVFAEPLRIALIARGFEAYLDKEDILPGEPWRDRLEQLILAADAVIFVISPFSISSAHCVWEVERTLALKKVLTPLLWRAIPDGALPEGLSDRNYVYFDAYERSGMKDKDAFAASMAKLETALKINEIFWIREHTKWVARAVEWEQAKPSRPEGKLLRLDDIAAARMWARLKPATAPEIPPVLADYLAESSAKEERDTTRLRRTTARAFVAPVSQAVAAGRDYHALRLMAAASLLADDLDFTLVPQLWPAGGRAVSQGRLRMVLEGHSDAVNSVAFSPDGSRILTAAGDYMGNSTSKDCTARIWDADSGKEIVRLQGHSNGVHSAAFSPDGNRIVTASWDASVRIWDAESGRAVFEILGHKDKVYSAAFSPAGNRIVTSSGDRTARVWDARTAEEIIRLEHDGRVSSAVFSPDGHHILTASWDRTARLWNGQGKQLTIFRGHASDLYGAAFSPDGARIVTASADQTARVWDSETGNEFFQMKCDSPVNSVAFSPDGGRILSGHYYWGDHGTARIWDAGTGEQLVQLRHASIVLGVAFRADGNRVVTGADDGSAMVWDSASGQQISQFKGDGDATMRTAFSPDGRRIVTASRDAARVWDVDTSEEIVQLRGHTDTVNTAVFSPDGRRIVTASRDNTVRVWDVHSANEVLQLRGHTDAVRSAKYSPDGSRIVTACADRTARVWDAYTGEESIQFKDHHKSVNDAAFSPDGARIVTATYDGASQVFDVVSKQRIAAMTVGQSANSVAFSPDGTRIVTGSGNGPVLWDAQSGKTIAWLGEDLCESAAFSPNGSRIATGSSNGTVSIWDAGTGNEVARLEGHSERVESVAFSPDGNQIVTASRDATARIWDVSKSSALTGTPRVWLAAALAHGAGSRTAAERNHFLLEDAPDDLFEALCERMPEELDRIDKTVTLLKAPLHPRCYLAPSQRGEAVRSIQLAAKKNSAPDLVVAAHNDDTLDATGTRQHLSQLSTPVDARSSVARRLLSAVGLPARIRALLALIAFFTFVILIFFHISTLIDHIGAAFWH